MQQLIEERHTREKSLPRRKKPKKIKVQKDSAKLLTESTIETDEDDGEDEYEDEEECNGEENYIQLSAAEQEANVALVKERELTESLASKLSEMENQLVRGGRNILESYDERQMELERRLAEIAERKVIKLL